MKKSQTVLFILRLFLYFSVIHLAVIHPGVIVSFDRVSFMQWYIIIPMQAILAFLPIKFFTKNPKKRFIIAGILLVIASVAAEGFGINTLQLFFAGLASFILTYLLFYHPRWAKIAAAEPFFLAWVCLRLLAFSRSGVNIEGVSMAVTQFFTHLLFVWTAVVFLFHSIVVYLCLNSKSRRGVGKEGMIFFAGATTALVLVLLVLPFDFIQNAIIENLRPERMPERIRDDSERGLPREGGGRRQGRRTLPQSGEERRSGLRGLPEHSWQNRTDRGRGGDGEAENRQYLVKVVASEREPVYMGNSFRGQLDPERGFLARENDPLNRLASQRFFVTWFEHELIFDFGRRRQEIFSLSTLSQKYLPYRPVEIDPPIISENAGPLRFIHQVVSETHFGDPLQLVNFPSRPFNNFEKRHLTPYLELPLEESDLEFFTDYLNKALENWQENRIEIIKDDHYLSFIFSGENEEELEPVNEHMEIILAILTNFSKYQYNINYNDEYSIEALKEFILNSNEGDCVEFSNTLALLGRIAGIPSRVATGYLAAEGLQTPAHLRGLSNLRAQIPALQQFPFEHLYMVTNLHSHSWTQFYIPDYGWLDFEATSFSIPPVGMGDFNTWDVVIPIIDERRVFSNVRKFPWQAVLRATGILAIFSSALAYALRYGREAALYIGARRGGRAGARALYLLLLARLAADGMPIKPASKTAHEYAKIFPENFTQRHREGSLDRFASLYSELRWRQFESEEKATVHFAQLKQEYYSILKTTRRRGFFRPLIRILSLRGLAYL
jgi:hypothetical protein